MFKTYYRITKPGIIYGNLVSVAAGFFYASKGNIEFILLAAVLAGSALIMASACVFNNILDRDIDAKMERTRKRALAQGTVSVKNALIYGLLLGVLGSLILIPFVNFIAFLVGFTGFVTYVFIYTFIKRVSSYGTLVGSIPGATPPVAGYVAVTNNFDTTALLLFIILVVWQMSHFYSIAIFRIKEYKAAGIPVLPIVRGVKFTKITMTGYIVLFLVSITVMTIAGFTGLFYLLITFLAGVYWLVYSIRGFSVKDDTVWAKKMFVVSLKVLMTFLIMISLNVVLP